jgi:hypothetical protein
VIVSGQSRPYGRQARPAAQSKVRLSSVQPAASELRYSIVWPSYDLRRKGRGLGMGDGGALITTLFRNFTTKASLVLSGPMMNSWTPARRRQAGGGRAACACWPMFTGVRQRPSKTGWVVTHFVTRADGDHVHRRADDRLALPVLSRSGGFGGGSTLPLAYDCRKRYSTLRQMAGKQASPGTVPVGWTFRRALLACIVR